MSNSPSGAGSYVRRNLPPLIVGVAALVAIIGALVVVIDRVRDDDSDAPTRVADLDRSRDRDPGDDRADDDLDRFLEGFGRGGLLLGVSLSEDDGALVVDEVIAGTPADDAGIEPGDEIREVDGERVRSVEELQDAIADIEVGETYELSIERDGDERELTVRREAAIGAALAALLDQLAEDGFDPDDFDDRFDFRQFDPDQFDFEGFDDEDLEWFLDQFRFNPPEGGPFRFDLDPDLFDPQGLRPTLGLTVVQTSEGLTVVQVDPGSAAAEAGLEREDVILEVDGRPVETIDALRDALPRFDLTDHDGSRIVAVVDLLVRRDGRELELQARFSLGPLRVIPTLPGGGPLPLATPELDQSTQRLLDELRELESFLDSDEFLERFDERLRDQLEALVDEALASRLERDDVEPAPTEPARFKDLEVYRGVVEVSTDDLIVLGGSRGSIAFEVTAETEVVGAAPRVGGISMVAADGDGRALLVLTTT